MKNTMKTLSILLILAGSAFAQLNTVVQTSLSSSITATQNIFNVASATGIQAPTVSQAGSSLYIVDPGQAFGEQVNVIAISSTTLTVSRAGGKAKSHVSGAMVLVATNPNWFTTKDPAGSCVLANTTAIPTLNILNGAQWYCSAQTLSWVPGWGNSLENNYQPLSGTATASVAGTTVIAGPLVHINGTNAITAFQPSVGWQGQGFCIVPDAAFTTTTGGTTVASTRVIAIAKASTAVANQVLCYTYDAVAAKLVPSY